MTHLKNVLLINAVSSGATGLLLIVFPGFIAELFGTTQAAPFTGVGIFLLLFAMMVFMESRRDSQNPRMVRSIIVSDVLWVLGSLVIVLFRLFNLSIIGYLLIGAVALWVTAMAWLQFKGLSKLQVQMNYESV